MLLEPQVLYSILAHDGTAEPLRVSPPEAVAYLLESRPLQGGRGGASGDGQEVRGPLSCRASA
jgi:hypothetical protein